MLPSLPLIFSFPELVGKGGEWSERRGLPRLGREPAPSGPGRLRSCVCPQEERGEALVAGEHGRSLPGTGRDCGWRVRRRWRKGAGQGLSQWEAPLRVTSSRLHTAHLWPASATLPQRVPSDPHPAPHHGDGGLFQHSPESSKQKGIPCRIVTDGGVGRVWGKRLALQCPGEAGSPDTCPSLKGPHMGGACCLHSSHSWSPSPVLARCSPGGGYSRSLCLTFPIFEMGMLRNYLIGCGIK